jgi:hypothetical protein
MPYCLIVLRTGKAAGILSLSAASAALLQGVVSTEAQASEEGFRIESALAMVGETVSKTAHLILEPSIQGLDGQLLAHASHSSHSSHSSHASGVSDSDVPYYAPVAPAPNYPAAQPAQVRQTPVRPVQTNSAPVGTGISTNLPATNNLANASVAPANKSYLDSLKLEAAQGSASSQYALALYYIHGNDGCETNIEKAGMLLELSALQGNGDAKKRLDQLNAVKKADEEK